MKEWAAFDNLLAKSDAEYEIAFRLFDVEGTGVNQVRCFPEDIRTESRSGQYTLRLQFRMGVTLHWGEEQETRDDVSAVRTDDAWSAG